jgi:alpha-beta hydrolase superfamily lysophospholipase
LDSFKFEARDGKKVHCYHWSANGEPKAIIHIAHGMGEHAARYDWTASKLAQAGYEVYANDHRAHGLTADVLGDFGEDGWNHTITDLHEIIQDLKAKHPGVPVILFGHSMGAMLSQQYIAKYGNTLNAVILSGSPGAGSRLQMWLVHTIARFERWRVGGQADSALLQGLLFGSSNKDFDDEPDATGYEWLSRDKAQVKLYVDDPMCGFVPCPRSICDLFAAERANWKIKTINQIPVDLPVYLFSGSADPVHNDMKNINRLLKFYRNHGLNPVTHFYPEGRHEMLNETNQDGVIEDLISWLSKTIF